MDNDLVTKAQSGDTAAFERLALASHARFQRTAVGILRDPHLAEDAVQQALLSIWRDIPKLRDPARFEAWSYRLLVRACYAEGKRRPERTLDIASVDEPAAPDAIGAVLSRDEIERAFGHLTFDQRSVLVLHYLMDLTSEQVADVLEVRVGTVKSRLGRALKRLRETMEPAPSAETSETIQQEAAP